MPRLGLSPLAAAAVGALVGLGIGYVLGTWGQVSVASEVNLTDLLTLLATIVLTVLVAIIGQKRFGEDRAEKDLLIGVDRAALDRLHDVHAVFRAGYYGADRDLDRTTEALDALAAELAELVNLLDEAGHDDAFRTAQQLYAADLITLRRLVSGGGFPAEPYPRETFDAEAALVNRMEAALRRLVFTINRR